MQEPRSRRRYAFSLPLQLSAFGLELFADVLPGRGEAKRATVPFEPVKGDIVADGAVADKVGTTAVQQINGGQQRRAKVVMPRGSRRPDRAERLGGGSAGGERLGVDNEAPFKSP